jgi:hypothetical protein
MVLTMGVLVYAVVVMYVTGNLPFQGVERPAAAPSVAVPAYVEALSWEVTAQRQALRLVHYEDTRTAPPPDALNVERAEHRTPAPDADADPSSSSADPSQPSVWHTYRYDRMEWVPLTTATATATATASRSQQGAASAAAEVKTERWSGVDSPRPTTNDLRQLLSSSERLVDVRFRATAKLRVKRSASDSASASASAAATTPPAPDAELAADERERGEGEEEEAGELVELSLGLYGFDALFPDRLHGLVELRDGMLDIGESARAALDQRIRDGTDDYLPTIIQLTNA